MCDISDLTQYLQGGDLCSIVNVEGLVPLIKTQSDFDTLFRYLHSDDRLIAMREADSGEKISRKRIDLLQNHKKELMVFMQTADDKEFKWHLAQLASRLVLSDMEIEKVWTVRSNWTKNEKESKIVRVNALQSLYDLSQSHIHLKNDFKRIVHEVELENIPSLNARTRKLK